MEHFNVLVSGGCVVAVNRAPFRNGIAIGDRLYHVLAKDRDDAKRIARERYRNGEPSDDACWAAPGTSPS